jgi:hypothetical protein
MPRRGAGDQLGLVVAALGLPCGVQRDGHDHILTKLPPGLAHDIGQPRGKPVARAPHLLVLQQRAGAEERVVVDRLAARGYRRNKRATTARARRFRDFKERCKAGLADRNAARVRERRAADAARRRKHDRGQRLERALQYGHFVGNREGQTNAGAIVGRAKSALLLMGSGVSDRTHPSREPKNHWERKPRLTAVPVRSFPGRRCSTASTAPLPGASAEAPGGRQCIRRTSRP